MLVSRLMKVCCCLIMFILGADFVSKRELENILEREKKELKEFISSIDIRRSETVPK